MPRWVKNWISDIEAASAAFMASAAATVAILRQQHLRERAEIRRRRAGFACLGSSVATRRGAVGSHSLVSILGRGRPRLLLGLAEEQVEALGQRLLLVLVLRDGQQQRVAQDVAVVIADVGDRIHRIDAFRGRNADARATRSPEEYEDQRVHG